MAAIKRDAADIWFSLCVRARANWTCEHCGKGFPGPDQGLHCAHIYGRRNNSTRWSMDNAVSLCAYHHRYFTEHPVEFTRWLEDHLGQGHLDLLLEKRNGLLRATKDLRKEISAHYRAQFQAYEASGEPYFVSYN